jgi:peptide/nickel transport system permease protein
LAIATADREIVVLGSIGARSRRRGRFNWTLTAGLTLLTIIVIACLAAPLLAPDPTALNLTQSSLPPLSPGHFLGTDAPFGRDVLSRILYGGRIDLLIGFGATGVTLVAGSFIGLVSGYFGGRVDTVIMRVVDVFFAFPFLVLVLAIVAMLGQGLLSIFIAIWAIGWVSYARIIRGETLAAKKNEYVVAAQALGYSRLRIMVRHILPNVVSAAIIFSMVDAIANIVLAASLGYLGSGVPPPTPEWGSMVNDGQLYLSTAWWIATLPGAAIMITGTALSLIGDGLADILRPSR